MPGRVRDPVIRARLDRIVEKRLPVVVGDAGGADKAVQDYLKSAGHDLVQVFAADVRPRNNVGGWPVRVVGGGGGPRDFEHYAAKDRLMVREASVGLMLWDGESRGTLLNVLRLVGLNKPVVVYVGPRKDFVEIRNRGEVDGLSSRLGAEAARRFREQAIREGLAELIGQQATLL